MRWITYALAAGLVAGLSGCGGGADSGSSGTVPPMGANAPVPVPSGSASIGASASSGTGGQVAAGSEAANPTGGRPAGADADPKSEEKYAALEAKLAKDPDNVQLKLGVAEAAFVAGHYIEYDKPGLSPREKYRPALKLYNRALALNPQHVLAAQEKKQIEDIYTQMGMPIPK